MSNQLFTCTFSGESFIPGDKYYSTPWSNYKMPSVSGVISNSGFCNPFHIHFKTKKDLEDWQKRKRSI